MRRTWFFVAVFLLLMAVSTSGIAQTRVLLYTSVPLELATKFADEFMKQYSDVKVEVYRAGSTDVINKIWAEHEAGGVKADLIWLADAASYYTFKQKGLLQPYKSPEASYIPEGVKDPEGYFTGARIINMIIGINTNLVKDRSTVKGWDDLLRLGSKAAMANPLYSGSNFMVTAAFVKKQGGWAWFEKARKNGVLVLRGNSDVARGLAAGEYAAAMVLDYMVYELRQKGAPVDIVWPEDGAVSIASPIAITSNSKNPAGAKQFIDFLLSKRGQELMVRDGVIPVRPDVQPPSGMPTADKIKMIPIPFEWAAEHTAEIRETFERIVLQ
ncbi:MAG: ABC transporter substrate-binding protein [Bacillota bacterium]